MLKKLIISALLVFIVPSPAPTEQLSGDVNCDEAVNILDVVHLINYKYKEGDPPCPIRYPETPAVETYKHIETIPVMGLINQWVNVAEVSIAVPGSGIIILEAQARHADTPVTSFCLGLSTSPDDGEITYESYSSSPFSLGVINYGENLHEVIKVDAGTHTFYYNLFSIDTGYRSLTMISLVATFYPDNADIE